MSKTTEYPIRTDHLDRGSIITIREIEEAFGISRTSPKFRFKVLHVKAYVEDMLLRRGLDVVVVERHGNLHILLEDDAESETYRGFRNNIGRAMRKGRKHGTRDRSLMSPQRLAEYDSNLSVVGRTMSFIRESRKPITQDTARQTPRSLGGKKK